MNTKQTLACAVAALVLAAGPAHAGTKWKTVKSTEYGIQLDVPDPDKCETKKRDDVAGMYCDYGDMRVVVIAYNGTLDLSELREAAYEYSEVPEKHWRKQGTERDENGYKIAEAWAASHGGDSVLGLIGQSKAQSKSHVVFIHGSDKAWKANKRAIARFIDNIYAI